MDKINTKKVIFIVFVTIGVFYISLRLYSPILHFLMMPISDAMASGSNVPLAIATTLGERFTIAFKIALFISSISIVLMIDKRMAIAFIAGSFIAYIFVLYGLFDIWNNGIVFSIEHYITHLLSFLIAIGVLCSAFMYKKGVE